MNKSIKAVIFTLLFSIQLLAQDVPSGKPAVSIDLATIDGVESVSGQWKYSDTRIIETDFKILKPNDTLRNLIAAIKQSKRNLFAIVDKNGHLVGILTLDDVREVMFETALYDKILVKNLMKSPPSVLFVNESMSEVMKKFDDTNAWNLPVVDAGAYLGFISKSAIFSKYRGELMAMNKE